MSATGKDAEHSVDNVGTVPAALSTYLACQQYKPDLIISVGTAGGFKAQGAGIGDVFVGTTTVNHDRRIPIPVLQMQCKGMLPFMLSSDCLSLMDLLCISVETQVFWPEEIHRMACFPLCLSSCL